MIGNNVLSSKKDYKEPKITYDDRIFIKKIISQLKKTKTEKEANSILNKSRYRINFIFKYLFTSTLSEDIVIVNDYFNEIKRVKKK